ncbi:hypothetical protein MJ1_0159 [Nanobdella aerobiophila]|uniref:Uncharacterized protein n=1 Tax=Nanobdella aerobiophila TaxID=2586965 RepID=A0A915WR98_9ARCH|nr:hypothetical protein [Nanobdella aerobiophila]BBL45333.1 hypothetical protein MJ1_0159 [Nanobdella aerobiophila]
MNFVNNLKASFLLYKRNILFGFLYGIIKSLLYIIFSIPIIGTFIYSYLYPRILKYYYEKLTKEKLDSKLNISFISIFIPSIIQNILIFSSIFISSYFYLSILSLDYLNNKLVYINSPLNLSFYNFILPVVVSFIIFYGITYIMYIFSMNSFYGSILGKVNKYNLEINNSSKIFFNILTLFLISMFILFFLSSIIILNKYLILIPILIFILLIVPLLDIIGLVSFDSK